MIFTSSPPASSPPIAVLADRAAGVVARIDSGDAGKTEARVAGLHITAVATGPA